MATIGFAMQAHRWITPTLPTTCCTGHHDLLHSDSHKLNHHLHSSSDVWGGTHEGSEGPSP